MLKEKWDVFSFKAFCRKLWNIIWSYVNTADRVEEDLLTSGLRRGVIARFCISSVLVFVIFGLLGFFLYGVQVEQHDSYVKKSLAICRRNRVVQAPRGAILDVNGNVFAIDKATHDVFAEPKRFKDKIPQVAEIISRYLGMNPKSLEERLTRVSKHQFAVEISGLVSEDNAKIIVSRRIPGVEFESISQDEKTGNASQCSRMLYYPERATEEQRREAIDYFCQNFGWEKRRLEEKIKQQIERCQEISIKWSASLVDSENMIQELRGIGVRGGIRFAESWERSYPKNNQFANMLGFLDDKNHGVSGIEKMMDEQLQPVVGSYRYIHDKRGRPVEDTEETIVEPSAGADVYLTIIEPLQSVVEKELSAMVQKYSPTRAYAIMIDPSTGAIMALAQYPNFNPNDRASMKNSDNVQNHCILQSYDPGSIMKAISLTGVLDNHAATLNTVVDCEHGHWYYGGKVLRDTHNYDDLSLLEVIAKSSNIGTAKLAMMLGEEKMYEYLSNYLFGKRTGLGFYPEEGKPQVFSNEASGSFRALQFWDKLTITRMPMGQGISCTPIQIVQAWSALANDGVMMQPYLIDRVVYPDGRTIMSKPRVKSRTASMAAVRSMREALKKVTQKGGTATKAAVKGYEIAGKTGTAQMWIPTDKENGIKGHYSQKEYFSSFIGYAPAENPRFLLLVSAEYPKGYPRTGGWVSGPVFANIAAQTLEYLQLPPAEESEIIGGAAISKK